MCVIKSGYALAPVQAELSAYSLPDQPINNCYTPGLLSINKLYVSWAKKNNNWWDNCNLIKGTDQSLGCFEQF